MFYHPTLVAQQNEVDGEVLTTANLVTPVQTKQQQIMPVSQPLFPSAILSVVPNIIELFDDVQIDCNGNSGIFNLLFTHIPLWGYSLRRTLLALM